MRGRPISRGLLIGVLLAFATHAVAQTSTGAGTSRGGSRGSSSIGQSNPGTQDISRATDANQVRNLPGAPSPGATSLQTQLPSTSGTVNTPLAPNSNGVGQTLPATSTTAPTLGTGTSGAISTTPPGTTTAPGAAASSGTASPASSSGGATGRNMPECMSAWDKATHISKPRWREICARTLTEPHI
jgi:hypothetical protein